MSVLLGDMLVRYKADVSDLQTKSDQATKAISGVAHAASGGSGMSGMFSNIMGGAGKMVEVVGGAFLAVGGLALKGGAEAVKMAGDFQESMTQLVTGAGESASNIKLVSDGILNMAGPTGTATKDLAAGMYLIESAGYHGAQGLSVLQAATEGAKVGAASLADVANGVTTAMTDYAKSGITAAQATNDLIATVAAGKTHMGDLARSMSNILPVSSALHVSFSDVSAAMATMTGEGTSAQLASTYLKQTLLALTVPSKGAVAALASIGLTSKEVATDLQKSLPDTLKLITDDIGKKFPAGSQGYIEAVKAISGGSKNMMAMLDLTGSHMATLQDNLKNITGAVKSGGNAINGWADVQKDFNFQMDSAKASLEAFGIKIGTALLPVVTQFMTFLTSTALPALNKFSDWFLGIATPVLQNFAKTITTYVQPAITAMTGLFQFLDISAQASTLDMQLKTNTNTLNMAQKNVANIEAQKQGIIDQLDKTSDAHQKAFLLMQLNALNASDTQAKGVVANYIKQRQGIQAQLDALNPATQLATLRTKDTAISNTISMSERTIAGYAQMRQGLVQQLNNTTDDTKRDALKRQIAAIDAATKQQQGVVAQAEKTRQGIEANMKNISTQAGADSANPFINAWKGAVAWFQSINWGGIFGVINTDINNVVTVVKSVDWGGIFKMLWTSMFNIANFLQSNFAPAWFSVSDEWKSTIAPALSQLNDALSPIYPLLKAIVALDFVTFVARLAGAIKALSGFVQGVSVLIGGVILMFTGWVQLIHGFLQFLWDVWTMNWGHIKDDFTLMWTGIQNIFKGYLTTMAGYFLTFWLTVKGYVTGFCETVTNLFQGLFDTLVGHSIVPDMINKMLEWFKNFGPNAVTSIQGAISDITSNFTNLAAQAPNWGHSLMTGFISGVQGMMGSLGSTMQNVVGYIGSFLPHSPAKQGELQHLNEYGPAFVKGFADGILKSQPVLKAAMHVLVSPTGQAVAYPIQANPGIVASAQSGSAQQQQNGQGQVFILEVDGNKLAQIVNTSTDRIVRLKLGAQGRAA